MNRRHGQRGDVPVGCLVGLIVLGLAVMVGIKTTPIIINVGEFEKEVVLMADRANSRGWDNKRMIQTLVNKADELGVPVTPENILIERTQSRFRISVSFVKEIEFPGYTYVWDKKIDEERPLF
jgi:hypothetical protein